MIVFGWRASRKANFGALIVLVLFMVILVVIGTVVNHGRDPRYMGNTGLCEFCLGIVFVPIV